MFCVVFSKPLFIFVFACLALYCYVTGRRGRDRMVVGITTICINQFLSPLMLWVRTSIKARSTAFCDDVCE